MTEPIISFVIEAQSADDYALGEQYYSLGRKLVLDCKAMLASGVNVTWLNRTMSNGVTINVMADGENLNRVVITVPPFAKPEKKSAQYDYIWIGLEQTDGGLLDGDCGYTPEFPDNGEWDGIEDRYPPAQLMLWVWEPPETEGGDWEIFSWWPARFAYDEYHDYHVSGFTDLTPPEFPDLSEYGLPQDGTFEAQRFGGLWKSKNGSYMIWRDQRKVGIKSPLTDDALDGPDLWHQVYVMDPKDGEPQTDPVPFWPVYSLDDDGVSPEERPELMPATATGPEYLAKVCFTAWYECWNDHPASELFTPATGKIKIISGKGDISVVDRMEFTVEKPEYWWRTTLPLGCKRAYQRYDQVAGEVVDDIPAGENAMNSAWHDVTFQIGTKGSINAASGNSVLPYGLNQDDVSSPVCYVKKAVIISTYKSIRYLNTVLSTVESGIYQFTMWAIYSGTSRSWLEEGSPYHATNVAYTLARASQSDKCGDDPYTQEEMLERIRGLSGNYKVLMWDDSYKAIGSFPLYQDGMNETLEELSVYMSEGLVPPEKLAAYGLGLPVGPYAATYITPLPWFYLTWGYYNSWSGIAVPEARTVYFTDTDEFEQLDPEVPYADDVARFRAMGYEVWGTS